MGNFGKDGVWDDISEYHVKAFKDIVAEVTEDGDDVREYLCEVADGNLSIAIVGFVGLLPKFSVFELVREIDTRAFYARLDAHQQGQDWQSTPTETGETE